MSVFKDFQEYQDLKDSLTQEDDVLKLDVELSGEEFNDDLMVNTFDVTPAAKEEFDDILTEKTMDKVEDAMKKNKKLDSVKVEDNDINLIFPEEFNRENDMAAETDINAETDIKSETDINAETDIKSETDINAETDIKAETDINDEAVLQTDQIADDNTALEDSKDTLFADIAYAEPTVEYTDANDELTIITKGTTITGNITSDGSLEVMGVIHGDIDCLGKLTITGDVIGNSMASEVYVNTKRLEGSINSEGSVKINGGSIVVGDITASSGVIAGAVKGQIDINGPVIVDSNAVIKGNINAKSVQVNNGAVIDGFCSLSYSEVDIDGVFAK